MAARNMAGSGVKVWRPLIALAAVTLCLAVAGSAVAGSSVTGCTQTGTTCTTSACETVDGTCVCVAGTSPLPSGCILDSAVTCWNQTDTYNCYTATQYQSCSGSQLQGCQLLSSTCATTLSGGQCVNYTQTWACPTQATTTCNPVQPAGNCSQAGQTCLQSVEGYCVDQDTDYSCNATTSYCDTDPGCTLVSQTCATSISGQCAVEDQTYQCTTTGQTCLQYQTSGNCASVNTAGLQNQTSNPDNNDFAQAVEATELLDAIRKNIDSDNPPRIFDGTEMTCGQEWGCSLGNCCCDTSLSSTSGTVWNCSQEEVRLAGYRRANLAVNVTNGCDSGVTNPFSGSCLWCTSTREYYCVFDNLLAALVQEQGRPQLAAMAANGYAGASQTPFSYPFYATGSGQWAGPVNANGNDVWVWEWPAACNTTGAPPDHQAFGGTISRMRKMLGSASSTSTMRIIRLSQKPPRSPLTSP